MKKIKLATLEDVAKIEEIGIEQHLGAQNTYDMIKNGAAINPDAPALSFFPAGDAYQEPMVTSYRELLAKITQTANLFHDLGIGPNDVISYLLPNLPQTHFILWGGEAVGIINPINPMLEPKTIRDLCLATGTKVLVALGDIPGSDIWPGVEAVRNELPNLKAIVRVMGPSDEKNGIYGYEEVIDRYGAEKLDSGRLIDPEDVASMYHTGGTTGTPKLAPRTHFNEVCMAKQFDLGVNLVAGDTALCGLPLFHANGTTVTGSFPFSIGAHVVLLSPRGYRDEAVMRNFYKIVEHYRAVTFSAVPTILSILLDIPKGDADISSLRFAICGAAPLSVELFRRFEEHTNMMILEGYGLTEGTCASCVNPYFGERKVGSIGLRIPYQDMKSFVLDDEGEFVREAQTDEIGVIHIRGANVFKGYLDDLHNQKVWPKDDWFNTGDLGRQDEDGYFWLTGRRKELIIRGGHNIDPAIIENPLYSLPGIAVAAAVGRPDAYAGEVPVAYVQLQEGADYTPDQILDYLKDKIGERAAVPKEVIILDEMPLTSVGKIFKPSLRWEAVRRVFSSEMGDLSGAAEKVDIQVGEDKIHGTLAEIKITPAAGVSKGVIEAKAMDILSNHTTRFRLEIV